ncbi:hypothetical protein [Rufibacter psychrotolerans]|uniref:hypothetical protein n=1 Tax=Rufibacter psychrotolerans TaxID=2812556 RepID=UPI001967BA27|nr:hypothetical protein [Rufibacter sp. SYSU D00308]
MKEAEFHRRKTATGGVDFVYVFFYISLQEQRTDPRQPASAQGYRLRNEGHKEKMPAGDKPAGKQTNNKKTETRNNLLHGGMRKKTQLLLISNPRMPGE